MFTFADVPRFIAIAILGLAIGILGGCDWSQAVSFLP